MIIKGKARAGATALGAYLQNAEKNERVQVIDIKNTIAQDLTGALIEMAAYAEGTRCEKPLYHAIISPQPPYRLTREQQIEAVDALEEKLGLAGFARAAAVHEKLGREHLHIVWTRIDLETMKAVPMSHNFRKHEEVARDLEKRFDHPRVQGALHDRDGERPDYSPSRNEIRQEERTGVRLKDVRKDVTALFRSSDGPEAFRAALDDAGYILAKGDKRDFVVIDRAAGVHSLARRVEGMKAVALRDYMKPINRDALPSVTQAQEIQLDRASGLKTEFDEKRWEDALAAASIESARKADAAAKKAASELAKVQEEQRRNARAEAIRESDYSHGDGLVTQNRAAQADFKKRQRKHSKVPHPQHPEAHRSQSVWGRMDRARRVIVEHFKGGKDVKENCDEPRDVSVVRKAEAFDFNQQARNLYEATRDLLKGDKAYAHQSANALTAEESVKRDRKTVADKRHASMKDFMNIQKGNSVRDRAKSKSDAAEGQALGQKRTTENFNALAQKRYARTRNLIATGDPDLTAEQARKMKDEEERQERMRRFESERYVQALTRSPSASPNAGRTASEEMTDRIARRFSKLIADGRTEGSKYHRDPDRQREAPGGGHTRSR